MTCSDLWFKKNVWLFEWRKYCGGRSSQELPAAGDEDGGGWRSQAAQGAVGVEGGRGPAGARGAAES